MSRPDDRIRSKSSWLAASMLALCAPLVASMLALLPPSLPAQTIADYSRVQRALLEDTMAQAAARSAGMAASTPAPTASTAALATVPTTAAMPRAHSSALAPSVQVSGVFASRDDVVAEVLVNTTPYLLGAGQLVPGTPWHVDSVAIDRVVLSRQGGVAAAADATAARRVFALPALPVPR